jgi:ketosteroid isomerase-like protein
VSDPIDIVRDIYAARAAGDRQRMLASAHPSMIQTTNARPDREGDGDTFIGLPSIMAHLQRVGQHWHEEKFEPGRLRVEGEKVTCGIAIALRHKRTGMLLEGQKRQIWTVRDGQVRVLEEVFDAELVNAIHGLDGVGGSASDPSVS